MKFIIPTELDVKMSTNRFPIRFTKICRNKRARDKR